MPLATQIGRMIKIAVACATFVSIFKIAIAQGTKSIPPPAPKKPFAKPTKIPSKIKSITWTHLFIFLFWDIFNKLMY